MPSVPKAGLGKLRRRKARTHKYHTKRHTIFRKKNAFQYSTPGGGGEKLGKQERSRGPFFSEPTFDVQATTAPPRNRIRFTTTNEQTKARERSKVTNEARNERTKRENEKKSQAIRLGAPLPTDGTHTNESAYKRGNNCISENFPLSHGSSAPPAVNAFGLRASGAESRRRSAGLRRVKRT